MKFYNNLQSTSTGQKLLILLVCILIGSVLTGGISMVVFSLMNINPLTIAAGGGDLSTLKLIQLVTTIGLIGIPGYIAMRLFNYQDIAGNFSPLLGLLVVVFAIGILPVNEWLGYLNHQLELPEWLAGLEQWIYESEKNAAGVVKRFLQMNTLAELAFNLVLIALAPAVCEELLFRGALQRIFHERFNLHVAIILSAAIFSAFHMQFLGFLPRFVLGLVFGYFYAWSEKLIYPIIGHFTNNAFLVVLVYITGPELLLEENTISAQTPISLAATATVISIGIMYAIYQLTEKKSAL